MLKKVLSLVLFAVLLQGAAVQAADPGFYLEGGWGYGEIDHNDTEFDTDVKAKNFSGGFTLSTNTFATSAAPSYKLRVGYDRLFLEDQYDVTIESNGLRIDNGIGMPLVKNEHVRVTLGPLFRVGYYVGKSDGTIQDSLGRDTHAKTRVTAFGVGPELSLHLKLNDDLALGFDFGYMFNFFAGRIRGNFESDDYHGHRYNYSAGVRLLF